VGGMAPGWLALGPIPSVHGVYTSTPTSEGTKLNTSQRKKSMLHMCLAHCLHDVPIPGPCAEQFFLWQVVPTWCQLHNVHALQKHLFALVSIILMCIIPSFVLNTSPAGTQWAIFPPCCHICMLICVQVVSSACDWQSLYCITISQIHGLLKNQLGCELKHASQEV